MFDLLDFPLEELFLCPVFFAAQSFEQMRPGASEIS